jgi:hypothetical protein
MLRHSLAVSTSSDGPPDYIRAVLLELAWEAFATRPGEMQ